METTRISCVVDDLQSCLWCSKGAVGDSRAWAAAPFSEGRAGPPAVPQASSNPVFTIVSCVFWGDFMFISLLEIKQMLLINRQSPWVLHLLNQIRGWLENISCYGNFHLTSKEIHLPDLSNIKIHLEMSIFCFSDIHYIFRPLFCPKLQNIILVNKPLFHLTVQSHWDPSPLKENDLIFWLLGVRERRSCSERKQDCFCVLPSFLGT